MNYEAEASQLADGSKYLKLTEGVHEIEFLSELGSPEKKVANFDGLPKEIMQCEVPVRHEGVQKLWSVTVAKTKKSLYGQLVRLGQHRKFLLNTKCTAFVQGSGKTRSVMIQEVVALGASDKLKAITPNMGVKYDTVKP